MSQKYVLWCKCPIEDLANYSSKEECIQATVKEVERSLSPSESIIAAYIDFATKKRKQPLNQLEQAIEQSKGSDNHLLIKDLGNLPQNKIFADTISNAANDDLKIRVCGTPYIDTNSLLTLIEHAKTQRQAHGQLIKQGLARSGARSGNPNAAQVINQVNRPKIDNAILFAVLLQPVVDDYSRRGLSQRKMVEQLNTDGFNAPEGGKWVLSQLQKVLSRIRVNECALVMAERLEASDFNAQTLADELADSKLPCPLGKVWNLSAVETLAERLNQLRAIETMNEIVAEIYPLIEKYNKDELNDIILHKELANNGIISSDRDVA